MWPGNFGEFREVLASPRRFHKVSGSLTPSQRDTRIVSKIWNLAASIDQESPRQTKPKKGAKRKVHEFRPFLWILVFFLGKTSTIHIELLFRNAPAKSSWTGLFLVWFAGVTPELNLTEITLIMEHSDTYGGAVRARGKHLQARTTPSDVKTRNRKQEEQHKQIIYLENKIKQDDVAGKGFRRHLWAELIWAWHELMIVFPFCWCNHWPKSLFARALPNFLSWPTKVTLSAEVLSHVFLCYLWRLAPSSHPHAGRSELAILISVFSDWMAIYLGYFLWSHVRSESHVVLSFHMKYAVCGRL